MKVYAQSYAKRYGMRIFLDIEGERIGTLDGMERRMTGEWIPVNERLPEENTDVLVSVDENSDDCGMHVCDYYDGKFLRADAGYIWGVTHWMPLPEPPEVK